MGVLLRGDRDEKNSVLRLTHSNYPVPTGTLTWVRRSLSPYCLQDVKVKGITLRSTQNTVLSISFSKRFVLFSKFITNRFLVLLLLFTSDRVEITYSSYLIVYLSHFIERVPCHHISSYLSANWVLQTETSSMRLGTGHCFDIHYF